MNNNGNQLLGHWQCERGGNAEVFQTKKRGSHFYTRCDCCGLNQGTGSGRQQDIYDKAVFLPGVTVVKPSNVSDTPGQKVIEHEPVKVEAITRDFDPNVDVPEEPEPVKQSGGASGVLLPLSIFLAAVGAGVWLS